jgi:hypothetical protein
LTIEVGLIVVDAVGLFCLHFKEALLSEDGDNPLMRKVLDIYLSFLQIGLKVFRSTCSQLCGHSSIVFL